MPTLLRIWILLCAVSIFYACQKETTPVSSELKDVTNLASGVVADDPGKVAKVQTIMSSSFASLGIPARLSTRTNSKKDTDGDGIPDATDKCPKEKETFNGYLDTDGCPDTAPLTAVDADGDGKADSVDVCPTLAETYNGYQDNDGCPDVLPDSDGDGITDAADDCPIEAEVINGYMDEDGCPDTPPIILPPNTVPASYFLTMPPVQSQGGEGSCVPFAVAYAARSAEQFYKSSAINYSYTSNVFSPEFLYNQIKSGDCGSGTGVVTALDFLVTTGVCTWQSMPYSSYDGCSSLPTGAQMSEAANYKIASYAKIVNSDVTAIKAMLVNKHPVIITVATDQTFWDAKPGFVWKSYTAGPGISHSLVICGYDDEKHAWKVMNSWGTEWADAGFSWIDYDFLPQSSFYYGYVINN